jgi:hypothetical protein
MVMSGGARCCSCGLFGLLLRVMHHLLLLFFCGLLLPLFHKLSMDFLVEWISFDLELFRFIHLEQELASIVRVARYIFCLLQRPYLLPHVFIIWVPSYRMDPRVVGCFVSLGIWSTWRLGRFCDSCWFCSSLWAALLRNFI